MTTPANDDDMRSPAEVIVDRMAAGEVTKDIALIMMLGEIATGIWLMQNSLDELVEMAKMDAQTGQSVH